MITQDYQFDIPIVLIIFKRAEKSALIIDQISQIRPRKLYLIGDGPRSDSEMEEVKKCRNMVEEHITWPCEVIKNYADKNRGVYENIAGGANWVFEREHRAIFLEDDNYPALSFFEYCRELLDRYEKDLRVLWICGTNYHGKCEPKDGSDYFFTQLMLPCGWASWRHKFTKYYDGHIGAYKSLDVRKKIRFAYKNKALLKHDSKSWNRILYDLENGRNPNSWDYQMAFAIRYNSLYGIAPKYNQISNIGADIYSIHGGTTMEKNMTARFCEVPIYELGFPLRHPRAIIVDPEFEEKTEKTIIPPLKSRIKERLINLVKRAIGLNECDSLRAGLKAKLRSRQ